MHASVQARSSKVPTAMLGSNTEGYNEAPGFNTILPALYALFVVLLVNITVYLISSPDHWTSLQQQKELVLLSRTCGLTFIVKTVNKIHSKAMSQHTHRTVFRTGWKVVYCRGRLSSNLPARLRVYPDVIPHANPNPCWMRLMIGHFFTSGNSGREISKWVTTRDACPLFSCCRDTLLSVRWYLSICFGTNTALFRITNICKTEAYLSTHTHSTLLVFPVACALADPHCVFWGFWYVRIRSVRDIVWEFQPGG